MGDLHAWIGRSRTDDATAAARRLRAMLELPSQRAVDASLAVVA